jgi:hypothetical protein
MLESRHGKIGDDAVKVFAGRSASNSYTGDELGSSRLT